MVNEDCSVKLCDYGLARSITGVESADMIIKRAGNASSVSDSIEESDVSMDDASS